VREALRKVGEAQGNVGKTGVGGGGPAGGRGGLGVCGGGSREG
jgi:hypothetical protein